MSEKQSSEANSRVRTAVREGYARVAREGDREARAKVPCCGGGETPAAEETSADASCCGPGKADQVAQAVGYSEAELATLPEGANMGLSCGNPTALASLRPGEFVLDLGSGGGFDCFLAGQRVGAEGRVIGVDMTHEMLEKARRNVTTYRENTGLDNVEFRLGEIEHMPLADASVDVVISNCVINLSPDKQKVWNEIARVLRPGGRVAVSDLALLRPLPPAILEMVEALVGCVAGAVLVDQSERMMVRAGLGEIRIDSRPDYVDAMSDMADPLYARIVENLPPGEHPRDYITSASIHARKS